MGQGPGTATRPVPAAAEVGVDDRRAAPSFASSPTTLWSAAARTDPHDRGALRARSAASTTSPRQRALLGSPAERPPPLRRTATAAWRSSRLGEPRRRTARLRSTLVCLLRRPQQRPGHLQAHRPAIVPISSRPTSSNGSEPPSLPRIDRIAAALNEAVDRALRDESGNHRRSSPPRSHASRARPPTSSASSLTATPRRYASASDDRAEDRHRGSRARRRLEPARSPSTAKSTANGSSPRSSACKTSSPRTPPQPKSRSPATWQAACACAPLPADRRAGRWRSPAPES